MAEKVDILKAQEIISAEEGKEFNERTRLTVTGIIHNVLGPFKKKQDAPEPDAQNVYIKQEIEGGKFVFLRVQLSNNKYSQDVGKITAADKDTEKSFTGKGAVKPDTQTGDPVYVLYGSIGTGGGGGGYRGGGKREPWDPKFDDPNKKRRIAGGQLLNLAGAMAQEITDLPFDSKGKLNQAKFDKCVEEIGVKLMIAVASVKANKSLVDDYLGAVEHLLPPSTQSSTTNKTDDDSTDDDDAEAKDEASESPESEKKKSSKPDPFKK